MEEATMMRSHASGVKRPGAAGKPVGTLGGSSDLLAEPLPVACIELDRFCEDCSYNLRTLPVVPDPRTGIPVVRCTECGRFQPANTTVTALRPWIARVTSVTLFGWMFLLIAIFFWLGMAQGAINYATLEELTFSSTRGIERNTSASMLLN